MELNVKITIQSIIRTEQLLSKPFADLDFKNEDDIIGLLYCCVLCNNKETFTLDTFKSMCENKKVINKLMKDFEKESKCLLQFQENTESKESSGGKGFYIKDVVFSLIVSAGVDANFILNKASIYDLSLYTKAYEDRVRQDMERSRLWTYFNILPHIDSKKIKSPQDLFPFQWEKEEIRANLEKDSAYREEMFNKFMNGEIKI